MAETGSGTTRGGAAHGGSTPGRQRAAPPSPESLQGALRPFDRALLSDASTQAAQRLLGALLVRDLGEGERIVARVVETEAYHQDDPASHSHARRTPRSEPMFWQPGTAYVYRSYGVHWCLNVTVEPEDVGAAVLLRAAIPVEGHAHVRQARHPVDDAWRWLRGPGCLTRGLSVDAQQDRTDLVHGDGGLRLMRDEFESRDGEVVAGPRVGVRLGADRAWRWWLEGRPEVSVYRRSPRAAPPGSSS